MGGRARRVAAAVVVLLASGQPLAHAESIKVLGFDISTGGGCPAAAVDPPTRLGQIATANTYLRSLVTHDTSELRVTNDVVRTEEGGVTADGAQEICDGNQGPVTVEDAVIAIRGLRWPVVDGNQAIAFYLLDSPTSPTYIAERFEIEPTPEGGLIHHIEAIFYIDVLGLVVGPESLVSKPDNVTDHLFNSDDGPVGFFAPANHQGDVSEPAPADRAVVEAAAQSYLDALVSHDASAVPLAANAARMENRRVRETTADAIRADIASAGNGVTGLENVHIYIEGDEAIAMYKINSTAVDTVGIGAVFGSDIWAATRFHVVDGSIAAIESMCSASVFCGAASGPGA